ncbi:MAG: Protease HtpX-like protein [Parcubacteria group bacterium GW2011_GWC2_45_7]|nr:MAG: Protease HtpX-like protein [Parcubacteria group bacterium GW2011_GWC2_45_7]KKU74022.1 MAG: Protease HtpX-like protein [Parcubacteria group bacterium GW2011_GWA2_47_26]
MYNQITANKRRTWALIIIFVAVVLGLGYLYDYLYGHGSGGLVFAAFISFFMALISYYKGDKLALAVSGAKQINKEQNAYLWRMIENLCISQGMPMPHLHIIQDPAINAFATGRDPKHASIAVTTGAIEKLENEELEGVLAHELSHIKNYDIRIMTMVIVLVGIIALLSNWMLRAHLFGGRRDDRDRGLHPMLLVVGIVLMILAPLIAQLIQFAVSRRREYLADASGALMTRFPEGLARALEKIGRENRPLARANEATAHLYIANPFGGTRKWLTTLFSTHPPIGDRIKVLRSMA